jgi:hypothetical protein
VITHAICWPICQSGPFVDVTALLCHQPNIFCTSSTQKEQHGAPFRSLDVVILDVLHIVRPARFTRNRLMGLKHHITEGLQLTLNFSARRVLIFRRRFGEKGKILPCPSFRSEFCTRLGPKITGYPSTLRPHLQHNKRESVVGFSRV